MQALAVVEDLEILTQRGSGGALGRERLAVEDFTFQGGKEAFGHGVVVAVTD